MEVLLEPENINGGVMAVYDLFDLHGGRLKAFQKILTYTTAVSIEPLVCEKVRISVTVPDIFVFEE